jgi:hypothetical protein
MPTAHWACVSNLTFRTVMACLASNIWTSRQAGSRRASIGKGSYPHVKVKVAERPLAEWSADLGYPAWKRQHGSSV